MTIRPTIVFVKGKRKCDFLAAYLSEMNLPATFVKRSQQEYAHEYLIHLLNYINDEFLSSIHNAHLLAKASLLTTPIHQLSTMVTKVI